jgi:hypothetical protein
MGGGAGFCAAIDFLGALSGCGLEEEGNRPFLRSSKERNIGADPISSGHAAP